MTTLPPSCAVVMKSWNLSFLEPSGPLQACNGTALPLTFTLVLVRVNNFYSPVKGNAIPIKAWRDPKGSRRLRLPEFLESRHMKVARLSALGTGRL